MQDLAAKISWWMFIVAWLLAFAILWFFFSHIKNTESTYEVQGGQIVISPDDQGHYYLDGKINNYQVKFMLDTGATLVAIPKSLANKLHLKWGYPISLQTASGEVTGTLTRIAELSLVDYKFQNVKAVIIPQEEEVVLLGMNVLAKFNLSQQGQRLILQTYNNPN